LRIYACVKIYNSCSKLRSECGFSSPQQFTPLKDINGKNVDLGYCSFTLPENNINKMLVGGDGWSVGIECDKFKLLMIRPVKTNPEVFEHYFLGDKGNILNDPIKSLRQLDEINRNINSEKLLLFLFQDIRWKQHVLNTKSKSFIELLLSSQSDLKFYAFKMITAGNIYGQRGTGLLQTSSIKSIIYLGSSNIHGDVMAEMWSANGEILQTIKVSSVSYELSEDVIKHILSSYKYTLNELPSEEEIKKTIVAKTKLYEKYERK